MKFAVVEDNQSQATVLTALLNSAGYEVEVFANGNSCIDTLKTRSFDFFIIDWNLTDIGGDEVLQYIREHCGWEVPVIFCTARSEEESVADILRLGADDFVAKPIRYMELMARIESLIRRCKKRNAPTKRLGDIALDLTGRRIMLDGREIDLTQREFDLATIFFLNVGRLFSREELRHSLHGIELGVDSRSIDTYASRLRKKLKLGGEQGLVLSSVYGQGYRLDSLKAC